MAQRSEAERRLHAQRMREWRAKNPSAARAASVRWRNGHRDEFNTANRRRYWKNPDRYRAYNRTYMKQYRADGRTDQSVARLQAKRIAGYDALKDVPCADCGVRYPPYVMDFDHVRGPKVIDVSSLRYERTDRLKSEADKCDVVCSNCHRLRTFQRRMAVSA